MSTIHFSKVVINVIAVIRIKKVTKQRLIETKYQSPNVDIEKRSLVKKPMPTTVHYAHYDNKTSIDNVSTIDNINNQHD